MLGTSVKDRTSVWGPNGISQITPVGPRPPVASPEEDDCKWGIGEEADLITFPPIFDPAETQWTIPNTLWGVADGVPQRASPVVIARILKTLVQQIHDAQS
jgi:hypothetical protein